MLRVSHIECYTRSDVSSYLEIATPTRRPFSGQGCSAVLFSVEVTHMACSLLTSDVISVHVTGSGKMHARQCVLPVKDVLSGVHLRVRCTEMTSQS